MSKVTVRAKTVEEAVKSALSQLQTTEEFVNIRVIEEPSKGFFGLGAKQAVVEVERKDSAVQNNLDQLGDTDKISVTDHIEVNQDEDLEEASATSAKYQRDDYSLDGSEEEAIEEAVLFLESVLAKMDLIVKVHPSKQEDHWLIEVTGSNLGLMIGRRGQTLDSLQYLTNIVANRYSSEYIRIIIDAENYRAKRKETLEQLADRVAKKVIRTRSKVALEPMNAAERKIIHTHLQQYAGVSTKSDGQEPNRHIVIYPK